MLTVDAFNASGRDAGAIRSKDCADTKRSRTSPPSRLRFPTLRLSFSVLRYPLASMGAAHWCSVIVIGPFGNRQCSRPEFRYFNADARPSNARPDRPRGISTLRCPLYCPLVSGSSCLPRGSNPIDRQSRACLDPHRANSASLLQVNIERLQRRHAVGRSGNDALAPAINPMHEAHGRLRADTGAIARVSIHHAVNADLRLYGAGLSCIYLNGVSHGISSARLNKSDN